MNLERNKPIALLVGAGAVKNAWRPVTRAIQPEHFKSELSSESANSALARLIYLLRWYSDNSNDVGLNDYKEILRNTKLRICEEIKNAQQNGEITVREEFSYILNDIILSNCSRLMVVSTNWDTLIETALNNSSGLVRLFDNQKLSPAYIHGIYTNPDIIYLPTEVAEERYRTADENKLFGVMHLAAMKTLRDAHTLIIYGLSISSLDAELIQVLGVCLSRSSVKVVHVINPDHKIVAEKINLLLEFPTEVKVFGYDPSNLINPIDYSMY